jgi:hypothetical protein
MIEASAATAPNDSALAETVTEGSVGGGCPGGEGPGGPGPGSTGEEDPLQDAAQRIANGRTRRARRSFWITVVVSLAEEGISRRPSASTP